MFSSYKFAFYSFCLKEVNPLKNSLKKLKKKITVQAQLWLWRKSE